jgi:hypothetical protein
VVVNRPYFKPPTSTLAVRAKPHSTEVPGNLEIPGFYGKSLLYENGCPAFRLVY